MDEKESSIKIFNRTHKEDGTGGVFPDQVDKGMVGMKGDFP